MIAADSQYEVSFRPNWGDDGPIGHVVVRRLDDRAVVAEAPVLDQYEAERLLAQAEHDLHGSAADFELTWRIDGEARADPGPALQPGPTSFVDEQQPDRGRSVPALEAGVRAYPSADGVFTPDQPWLGRVLHPLTSIDLAGFGLSGWLTMLLPVEPNAGLLGETTPDHHNEWAGTNWISFELNDDSLMRFLGPRRYFGVQNPDVADDLRSWYDESERQFGAGRIRSGESGLPAGENVALVDQLGGEPGYGNWVAFRPPAALALDESNPVSPTLRLADGRPFTFIAATAGYPWVAHGPDAILMFFEPETRTSVFTFDWS